MGKVACNICGEKKEANDIDRVELICKKCSEKLEKKDKK